MLATSLLFDYIVSMYSWEAYGEPIWVIDPDGFWVISGPTGLVFFIGLLAVFGDLLPKVEWMANRSP